MDLFFGATLLFIFAEPTFAADRPQLLCRKVQSFGNTEGFELKSVVTDGNGVQRPEPMLRLRPDIILPCDPDINANYDNAATHRVVPSTITRLDGSVDNSITLFELPLDSENTEESGVEVIDTLDQKISLTLSGKKGQTRVLRDDSGKPIAWPKVGERDYQVELISTRLKVEELFENAKDENDYRIQAEYEVEIKNYPGALAGSPPRGWMWSTDFEYRKEVLACDHRESSPRRPAAALESQEIMSYMNQGLTYDEVSRLSQAVGKCVKPVNKPNTFFGRAIRHHLWEGHWQDNDPPSPPFILGERGVGEKYEGREVSAKELYAIDALARTLYREVGNEDCNAEGSHYMKAAAKTIMNRVDYLAKNYGEIDPRTAKVDPKTGQVDLSTGRPYITRPFIKEASKYNDDQLDGFKPRENGVPKPDYEILPYVLEASKQFSPWNQNAIHSPNNSNRTGDSTSCPDPESPISKQIWRQAVQIAGDIVLRRESFEASFEGDVNEYYFSHKLQKPGFLPQACFDSKKPIDREKYCKPVFDDVKVDGTRLVPLPGQASSTSSQFLCLQRWNSQAFPSLKELAQEQ